MAGGSPPPPPGRPPAGFSLRRCACSRIKKVCGPNLRPSARPSALAPWLPGGRPWARPGLAPGSAGRSPPRFPGSAPWLRLPGAGPPVAPPLPVPPAGLAAAAAAAAAGSPSLRSPWCPWSPWARCGLPGGRPPPPAGSLVPLGGSLRRVPPGRPAGRLPRSSLARCRRAAGCGLRSSVGGPWAALRAAPGRSGPASRGWGSAAAAALYPLRRRRSRVKPGPLGGPLTPAPSGGNRMTRGYGSPYRGFHNPEPQYLVVDRTWPL